MLSKGFPNQRPELFQDYASSGAYGGVKGGYTYLLPGSIGVVASSMTYSMIATMIRMPSVHLRYWVLASSLAKTLGAVMVFASLFATWPSLSLLHTLTLVWSKFSRQPHICYAYSLRQHVVLVTLSLKPMFT